MCSGTNYLIGKSQCVPWFFCHYQSIGLNLITLEVKSLDVETSHGVKLSVVGICQVKVPSGDDATDDSNIKRAAQHFLGQSSNEIAEALQLTMEGHQRQVLGTLSVEEIYKDREAFASKVREGVDTDMKNMGYAVVSYVVKDVSDHNGYMDALGATQTALVKREAAEGVARNESEQRKKVAEYTAQAQIVESQQQSMSQIEVNERRAQASIAVNLKKEDEVSLAQFPLALMKTSILAMNQHPRNGYRHNIMATSTKRTHPIRILLICSFCSCLIKNVLLFARRRPIPTRSSRSRWRRTRRL